MNQICAMGPTTSKPPQNHSGKNKPCLENHPVIPEEASIFVKKQTFTETTILEQQIPLQPFWISYFSPILNKQCKNSEERKFHRKNPQEDSLFWEANGLSSGHSEVAVVLSQVLGRNDILVRNSFTL